MQPGSDGARASCPHRGSEWNPPDGGLDARPPVFKAAYGNGRSLAAPRPGSAARVSIAFVEKALFDVEPKFLESIGRQESTKAFRAAQEGVVRIRLTVNTPGI